MVRYGLLIVLAVFSVVIAPLVHAEQLDGLGPILSKNTRLMVFSPHPDDESLGAGGLIQRILSLGGKVKVVFMTSGDGFPEGVELEDHVSHPTANDYRNYGKEREGEALKALYVLGLEKHDVIFLGFPDGGLTYLLSKFRYDSQAYRSPFTMRKHPPPSDMIIPHTDYNDRDLRKEIVRLLADFRPNLLATTPAEDQHPDHYATYHFVREALTDVANKDRAIKPRVLTFLIHFNQWPVQGSGTGSRLDPPEDFPDKAHAKEAKWISFPLSPREAENKREAILQYHTQMLVMGRSLLGFARANELFIMEDYHPAK
jgi:LmbE family N-acetylglucosaminyl deacetylase